MEMIEYTLTEYHGPDSQCRGSLADLLLDAFLIHRSGLVPPFRILRKSLLTGGSGGLPGCVWQPFGLSEDDYWEAVDRLGQMTHHDFQFRYRDPHISDDIRPDYDAPDTEDYSIWLDSLGHRGYLPDRSPPRSG